MIEITFNNIQIDSGTKNTGVLLGKNSIYGWTNHFKHNYNVLINSNTVGEVSQSLNLIDDRDLVDGWDKVRVTGTGPMSQKGTTTPHNVWPSRGNLHD